MTKIIINEEDVNCRLDVFLAEALEKSRSFMKKNIVDGRVLVNNQVTKVSYLLKEFDEITISSFDQIVPDYDLTPIQVDYQVIAQEDDFQIIYKPKGLVVHPAPGYKDATLVNGLIYNNLKLSDVNGFYRPGIVHRLDKNTDGLMIIANNNDAHRLIAKEFHDRKAIRKYYALVYGTFAEDSGTINVPIGRHPKNRLKHAVIKDGREAITLFTIVKRFRDFTLLSCELKTGRTHQIRVHMEYINHPIVGDELYGPKNNLNPHGQLLFAYLIGFNHPIKKEYIQYQLDIPEYFTNFMKDLI